MRGLGNDMIHIMKFALQIISITTNWYHLPNEKLKAVLYVQIILLNVEILISGYGPKLTAQ